MDLNILITVLIAVIGVETACALWNATPLGNRVGERYFMTSIICDAGLVVTLMFIMQNYWPVQKWDDALGMSMWFTLLFFCLQAPHGLNTDSSDSFKYYVIDALHKFLIIFVATLCLIYLKQH